MESLVDLFSPTYLEHELLIDGLPLKYISSDATSTDFDETGQILWRVSKVDMQFLYMRSLSDPSVSCLLSCLYPSYNATHIL